MTPTNPHTPKKIPRRYTKYCSAKQKFEQKYVADEMSFI